MKSIIISLIGIFMLLPLSVQAQTFQFQSAADGLVAQYNQVPAGSNSYLVAYGGFSGHTSTGTCVPATGTCRNLRIEIIKCLLFSGSTCTNELVFDAKLEYVSSTQINFITPVIGSYYTDYRVDVIRADTSAIVATAIEYQENGSYDYSGYTFTFQPNNMRMFSEARTINGQPYSLLRGTLYGCVNTAIPCPGYVALKSLSDGQANPRFYNGYSTLIQAYVTGATNLSDSVRYDLSGNYVGTIAVAGEYSTGIQLINLTAAWVSGVQTISFYYNGQANQQTAYIYWQ